MLENFAGYSTSTNYSKVYVLLLSVAFSCFSSLWSSKGLPGLRALRRILRLDGDGVPGDWSAPRFVARITYTSVSDDDTSVSDDDGLSCPNSTFCFAGRQSFFLGLGDRSRPFMLDFATIFSRLTRLLPGDRTCFLDSDQSFMCFWGERPKRGDDGSVTSTFQSILLRFGCTRPTASDFRRLGRGEESVSSPSYDDLVVKGEGMK
jgi:hypothetical protein